MSQIFALLSSAEAIKQLLGDIVTELILYLLLKENKILFWEIENIFIFLSFPPEINNFPEGEKFNDLTGALCIFIK